MERKWSDIAALVTVLLVLSTSDAQNSTCDNTTPNAVSDLKVINLNDTVSQVIRNVRSASEVTQPA